MKLNSEISKLDRFRMLVGTLLALIGIVVFGFAAMLGFALPPTLIGVILIILGALIAGSARLAALIYDLFPYRFF